MSAPGSDRRVTVLFPAAGVGARMGGERKQFRLLGGKPLLVRTIQAFDAHPLVDALIVSAPEEFVRELKDNLEQEGISKISAVVAGGRSRQESVSRALAAVTPASGLVLVHDAVRPFVSAAEIEALIVAADRHGAATLALPIAETVRRAAGDTFTETVSRDGLFRIQTPQGFHIQHLIEAHQAAGDLDATDDAELVQRLGIPVHVVEGSSFNIKITTPADWLLARSIWESGVFTGSPS